MFDYDSGVGGHGARTLLSVPQTPPSRVLCRFIGRLLVPRRCRLVESRAGRCGVQPTIGGPFHEVNRQALAGTLGTLGTFLCGGLMHRQSASCSTHREPLPVIADLYLRILDLILDLNAPDSAGFQFFSPERKKDPKVLISIACRIQWKSAA